MKKLTNMIFAAIAMVAVSTPTFAGSQDFAGPYIGIQAAMTGTELDGSHTSPEGDKTKGAVGNVSAIIGGDIGYGIPVTDALTIDIGIAYYDGSATFKSDSVGANNADVTMDAGDFTTGYIQPSYSFSESSAVYFKIGYTTAETSVTGDVNKPEDLEGVTMALGSKSLFPSGMFMKTEAGFHEFDAITATGKGTTGGVPAGNSVNADPTIAYGAVTIGYKF